MPHGHNLLVDSIIKELLEDLIELVAILAGKAAQLPEVKLLLESFVQQSVFYVGILAPIA